ncbi:MAG: hypothetical protein SCK70_10420 [bacterium]|nr:hypothetical protein [bacterium]
MSYQFIKNCIHARTTTLITHQNLLEFFAVVTSPKRVKHPMSFDKAFQKITFYQTFFTLISPTSKTFMIFRTLLEQYPNLKNRVFDLYLTATALDNGIDNICTWNIKDFKNIQEITVKTPEEIITHV